MEPAVALLDQNQLLVALLRDADPATPVPACPGWDLAALGAHVGRGDRWAAKIVRDRADSPVDPRSVPDGKPGADSAAWLASSPVLLLEAVAETGPDTPVWTFTGPRPASWWIRRRLHESLVHRADAALALGLPFDVAPALAADGVSEWLSLLAARPADEALLDGDATIHLHATDDLGPAGEWMVRGGAEGLEWEHGHGKGAVAVRGAAADLLLVLLRRLPPTAVEVHGDRAALDAFLARTPF